MGTPVALGGSSMLDGMLMTGSPTEEDAEGSGTELVDSAGLTVMLEGSGFVSCSGSEPVQGPETQPSPQWAGELPHHPYLWPSVLNGDEEEEGHTLSSRRHCSC